jgi:hypothetical protein
MDSLLRRSCSELSTLMEDIADIFFGELRFREFAAAERALHILAPI